jgi:hypothetical protein
MEAWASGEGRKLKIISFCDKSLKNAFNAIKTMLQKVVIKKFVVVISIWVPAEIRTQDLPYLGKCCYQYF